MLQLVFALEHLQHWNDWTFHLSAGELYHGWLKNNNSWMAYKYECSKSNIKPPCRQILLTDVQLAKTPSHKEFGLSSAVVQPVELRYRWRLGNLLTWCTAASWHRESHSWRFRRRFRNPELKRSQVGNLTPQECFSPLMLLLSMDSRSGFPCLT